METQNPFQDIAVRLSRIEENLTAIMQQQKFAATPIAFKISDTCSIMQAQEFLSERGYIISRSSLYKLTASNKIPHKRFGHRLVFSRAELLNWVQLQTVEKNTCREATLLLSKSANRKKGGKR